MYGLRACARLARRLQNTSLVANQLPEQKQQLRHIKRWVAPTLKELTRRKRAQKDPIVNQRSKYLDWNRNAELYAFNQRLFEKFNNELLERAFIDHSYIVRELMEQEKVGIAEPKIDLVDNRELIEEGKQILPPLIENYLNQALPLAPKECIYALKMYLISNEMLAKTASGIGTIDLILSMDYPPTQEIIVNTFYALISALNRSVDIEHTGIFVRDILISRLVEKDLTEIWCPDNALEILNDILVREDRQLVEPRIIGQTGINTLIPVYNIGLYSNKEFLGAGFGETIEEATHIAALRVIMKMFGLFDSCKPIRCDLKLTSSGSNNLSLKEWRRN